MQKLKKSARAILKNCLAVTSGEELLIVCDTSLSEIGDAFWSAAGHLTRNISFLKFRQKSLSHLPNNVCAAMLDSDVCVFLNAGCVNDKILSNCTRKKARLVALQSLTRGIIERASEINYTRVSNLSRKISDLFSIGKQLQITTPSGTDVIISKMGGLSGVAETGMALEKGSLSYLPAGRAALRLKNHNISGQITLDRISGTKGRLKSRIDLRVKKGHITQIRGEQDAEKLRRKLRKYGPEARNIYEIGVGTNYQVSLGFSSQEDESAGGTVHIAFGQDHVTQVHGKVNMAIKALLLDPTIMVDGKTIISAGDLLV